MMALVVVDVQRDFCEGGYLPVPNTTSLIKDLNKVIERFEEGNMPIIFSRDWHPENHCSFQIHGGKWPIHCVKDTPGAEFHPDLIIPRDFILISKGTETETEEYSPFDERHHYLELLSENGISCLLVCGIATEYCVYSTVSSIHEFNLLPIVSTNLIRSIEPGSENEKKTLISISKRGLLI